MLSLIVLVRNWPVDRVSACVRSFERMPAKLLDEIIVLDFGSEPALQLKSRGGRVRVVRVEAERWSLAEATNAAVLAARNDLIAKTDADVLISPDSVDSLKWAVDAVREGRYGLLHTEMVDLPPHLQLALAEEQVADNQRPRGRLRPRWGQGSLPIFPRSTWEKVGGYDSRLTGWGSEDNDFSDRVRRAGIAIGWTPPGSIRLYHVWHPPTVSLTHVARERHANMALVANDRSVFRPLQFLHSDISPIAAPQVVRAQHPLVTIAVATSERSGRDRMLAESVRSFRGQLDGDFEIVVLDNGSSDEAHESLRRELAPVAEGISLRIERQDEPSIPKARNEISRIARGRYICVSDDDDLALPTRLADHLRPFETDGLAHGSYGGWIDFDEESGLIEKNPGKPRDIATLLRGTGKVANHPSSFYRTDVLRAVPYDESLQLGSDWDLALRAGAMGLRFLHTGTFVTLRRFHTENVTLTGSSNQVSTGLRSRSRTFELYNTRQKAAYVKAARDSQYFVCNNDLSVVDLVAMLPSYVGQWRLMLPFAALHGTGPDGVSLLHAVIEAIDGELVVTKSGVDQEVMFCSELVETAGEAMRLLKEITAATGLQPTVVSDRQLQIDRKVEFDWTRIGIPSGGGVVMSEKFEDVADALEVVSALPPDTPLRNAARLVADYDKVGPAHYVIFQPTNVRAEARQTIAELQRLTPTPFRFAALPTAPSIPLHPTDRFH